MTSLPPEWQTETFWIPYYTVTAHLHTYYVEHIDPVEL